MNKEKILSELHVSYGELQDNFDLLVLTQDLYMKDWNFPANSPQSFKKIKILSRNFSRQLHSYLALFGAFNLQLINTKGKVKNADVNFVKDFDEQAKKLLTEKSLFIIQLRNFTFHNKLPMVDLGMHFLFTQDALKTRENSGIVKFLPSLQVSDLRSCGKWSPSSDKILATSAGDRIEILRYVAEAHSEIVNLFIWCNNRLRKLI